MSSEMLPENDVAGDHPSVSTRTGPSAGSSPRSLAQAAPPRLDAPEEDYAALRTLLATHRFDEPTICARTESPSLYDFHSQNHKRGTATPEHGLDALIWLFLDCHAMPAGEADALLGSGSAALLGRLGLVEAVGDTIVGTVLLYPTSGLYLISDRPTFGEKGVRPEDGATDLVYPAITNSVRVFVSTLPPSRGKRYLELCSGTGIAALDAAHRGAEHAWAIDITARSTHFAAFNARMNALPNVTALQGDLYAPVEGQQFDVISAHPPYVPATSTALIYRDGGEDGEQISRAIMARLPDFLAPEGIFHCTCLFSSRKNKPIARRLRDILGAQADEFDLVVLSNGFSDFMQHYGKELAAATDEAIPGVVTQMRRLRDLEVEQLQFCTIVMRRHGKPRVGGTVAVERDGGTRWAEVLWLLRMQDFLGEGERALAAMLEARPRLAATARLSLTYTATPGAEEAWTPAEGAISVTHPFPDRISANAADAAFYASCTGGRTFAEIFHQLQAEGALPPDLPPLQFMHTMVSLVAKGVLETDLLPFPNRTMAS
ncbi:MAG TPA: methyltransferase [Gemmatimonas aurantiaca]|uniref:Methyltransferase n=2 Tax=Gemmatimonas aurantiaca TaxID=173480 RepID=A0A3D4V9M3_9BACT|nr:methyltransferase [Gemmatimonas aurantiaca]HCT57805.1 methyltransferase [Gemmatimonas aurantiaca]